MDRPRLTYMDYDCHEADMSVACLCGGSRPVRGVPDIVVACHVDEYAIVGIHVK